MRKTSRWAMALALAASTTLSAQTVSTDRQEQVTAIEPGSALESVCHLWTQRKVFLGIFAKRYTGSAVLYKGRYLITAGHNIYQDKSDLKSIEVRCGTARAREVAFQQWIDGDNSLDAQGYVGSGIRGSMPYKHDYGVIRLDRPITVANPFTLAEGVKAGEAVHFAGFPVKKRSPAHSGWNMFSAKAKLTSVSEETGLAKYDLTTYGSNSGGPVWREVNGKPELAAIHVSQATGRVVNKEFRDEIARLIKVLDERAEKQGM